MVGQGIAFAEVEDRAVGERHDRPDQVGLVVTGLPDHVGLPACIHLDRRVALELVGEAVDGLEALGAIQALRPDVAVLDLSMPGLDGIEVATRLLAEGIPENTRAVLLTATLDDAVAARARDAGISESLSKDLSRREICVQIERIGRDRAA